MSDKTMKGYWKVPGRDVYCERFVDMLVSTLRCHVWLRVNKPNLPTIG
jgi:hypothetical protein